MCASSRAPFWQNRVFSLEVSQKCVNPRKMSARSVFFSRSHAAWESNFTKVVLKALAEAYFFFGGAWVVFSSNKPYVYAFVDFRSSRSGFAAFFANVRFSRDL